MIGAISGSIIIRAQMSEYMTHAITDRLAKFIANAIRVNSPVCKTIHVQTCCAPAIKLSQNERNVEDGKQRAEERNSLSSVECDLLICVALCARQLTRILSSSLVAASLSVSLHF